MTAVDVIHTYYYADQERSTVQVSDMTEAGVLGAIFEQLPDQQLAQLIKLSCAFQVSNAADLPGFVTNGKFHFNVEDNLDADTVRHCTLKMGALQARLAE